MPQFMPRRDDRFDYTKPVDGSDPATDWKGLHALESLPHVVNPPNGWVFNTNDWPYTNAGPDSPRREDFPRYMDTAGENPRGVHATRLLTARKDFTLESLSRCGVRFLSAGLRAPDPAAGAGVRRAAARATRCARSCTTRSSCCGTGTIAGRITRWRPRWPCSGATRCGTRSCAPSTRMRAAAPGTTWPSSDPMLKLQQAGRGVATC